MGNINRNLTPGIHEQVIQAEIKLLNKSFESK